MACSVHLHSWKGKDDPLRPRVLLMLLVVFWHKKWKNWTSHVEFWPSYLKIRLKPAMLCDLTSAHLIANVQQRLCNTPEERTPDVNSDGNSKPGRVKTELLNTISDHQRFAVASVKIYHGIPRKTNFSFANGKDRNVSYTPYWNKTLLTDGLTAVIDEHISILAKYLQFPVTLATGCIFSRVPEQVSFIAN
jgi:hypothetical protein